MRCVLVPWDQEEEVPPPLPPLELLPPPPLSAEDEDVARSSRRSGAETARRTAAVGVVASLGRNDERPNDTEEGGVAIARQEVGTTRAPMADNL